MYTHDCLVKARHDDLIRAAALCHLASQARPRHKPLTTAPVRILARVRAWRIHPVSPQA